jgi:hypothetical protein
MSSDIHINHTTFGKTSDLADVLVIELSENQIEFCELQSEQNKPLFVSSYAIENPLQINTSEHFINAVKHFQFSKKKYRNILINYFTPQFTLCPATFYAIDNSRSVLEFNIGNVSDKLILTDDINTDIKLIYAIDESLKSSFDQIFPSHHIKHTLTLLSKLMLQSDELVKENILLSVHSNYIEVIVKQDQRLMLANQFSVKTQEDILYYVLFIIEQYHFNPLTISLTIAGNVDSNSPLITSLKKYIKSIRLALGHKTITWSEITGMPQHFNYNLLNRIFCE